MNDKLTLKGTQQVEAELLSEFADFCETQGLRYYLYAGTLLGVIRHRGFIPWDDDTDVMMPRPDYERLMSMSDARASRGRLMKPGDEGYHFHFAKWVDTLTRFTEPGVRNPEGYGVFIDIYPLDAVALEDGPEQKREVDKITADLYYAYRTDPSQCNLIKNMAKWARGVIARRGRSEAELRAKLHDCCVKHDFESTGYVAVLCSYPFEKEVFPLEDLESDETAEFCGHRYRVVKNPEERLKALYGDDWRTPIKREVPEHGSAYLRNENV